MSNGAESRGEQARVGVVSCSGEAEPEGTIARNAVRMLMERLRPGAVVSICLPLYLAGGAGERQFAEKYPVIAVDGCGKSCARLATEKFSGAVREALDVRELLDEWGVDEPLSRSRPGELEDELSLKIAEELARRVDAILGGDG